MTACYYAAGHGRPCQDGGALTPPAIPLAKAYDFAGSRSDGVHISRESERAQLRAELDAAFFHLYQIPRPDAEYILSTFSNTSLRRDSSRPSQQFMWGPGTIGALILEAFDRPT